MDNTIVLQTFRGRNCATGEMVDWDFDEVLVNGRRVAHVSHAPGSGIRTLCEISAPTLAKIVEAVKTQRVEQGKEPISDVIAKPPTPEEMRAAVKQLKKG